MPDSDEAAYRAALVGDFREPGGVAWRSLASMALPGIAPLRLEDLHAAPATTAPFALSSCVLASVARADVSNLGALCELGRRNGEGLGPLAASIASAWWRWQTGSEPGPLLVAAKELQVQAVEAKQAQWVIESAALCALAALGTGDGELALKLARRASRMARTEEMPQHEYLAHLVLARVRRATGQPWLAARILAGLEASASPLWSDWIAWEVLLSSGRVADEEAAERSEFARATNKLRRALDAGIDGDVESLRDALRGGFSAAPLMRDFARVRAALDLDAEVPPDVAPWLAGEGDGIPSVIHGVFVYRKTPAEAPVWIQIGTGRRASWVAVQASTLPRLMASAQEGCREETLLSTLANGSPRPKAEVFAAVYGFPYREDLHEGTFRVLLHRAKHRLPEGARLEVRDEIQLAAEEPFWIADPRCGVHTDAFVLGTLAQLRAAGAKQIAAELGISVRTVQKSLRRLRESGACSVEKSGRRVEYVLEDTTFEEASRHHRGVRSMDETST
ncbi:MAG: helix-turn-helix domain-containing protein [Myxococcota bacterium]